MDLLLRRIEYLRTKVRMTQVMDHFGHRYRLNGNMLCPFHDEENPSARLYDSQDTFWCFVCSPNRGVDIIEYVVLALGLEADIKYSAKHPLSHHQVHSLATFSAIEYIEAEFDVSFLAEPWEKRMTEALRQQLPREQSERYWRNAHTQVLRVLASCSRLDRFTVYSDIVALLVPLRHAPVARQRPLWDELRSSLAPAK